MGTTVDFPQTGWETMGRHNSWGTRVGMPGTSPGRTGSVAPHPANNTVDPALVW